MAPNVIQGLAVSLESTALPALVIMTGIIVAYGLAGLFGIAIAVTTMLALAGMIVALDAFGPVTDNAGGIAEMSGMPKEIRKTTDALDAVGNTTKAVTKGYAIGSAGLGALVLFAAYTEDLKYFAANADKFPYFQGVDPTFTLSNPYVVVGLFLGGPVAVSVRRHRHDGGRARRLGNRRGGASPIQGEARHHEGHRPAGLRQGRSTSSPAPAIKEMLIPSLLPVLSPIVFYFIINWIAGKSAAFSALGAMLLGVIVTGLVRRHLDDRRGEGPGITPRNISRTDTTVAKAPKRIRRR
jgi:K(+)-stimulated pyrophosphate-energized sodium pump